MQKNRPLRKFFLDIPMWNSSLSVYVGKADSIINAVKKEYCSKEDDLGDVVDNCSLGGFFVLNDSVHGIERPCIWISDPAGKFNLNRHTDRNTLMHESLHASFHILGRVGIKHSDTTEECFTYLQSWIYNEIFNRLSGKKK